MSLTILLINPPSENSLILPMDAKKVRNQGHKPPLGILSIGSYLKKHLQANIILLDAQVRNMTVAEVIGYAERVKPDVVGISTWTDFWYDICTLSDGIKSVLPETHICLGGPHLSIYPKESLTRDCVDSIVVGDGETPFHHLIQQLKGKELTDITGLYFRKNIDTYEAFEPFVLKEPDRLPLSNRRLLPYQEYASVLGNGMVTTMVTSRGCPHKCIYCKLDAQKTMFRSPESVVSEMEHIKSLGINEIEIYDDTFGSKRSRVLEICRLMKQKGLKFRITIRDRVSNIDEAVISALKDVGLVRVYLGVESVSNDTLKTIKKQITVEQSQAAIEIIKAHGIEVLAYFMIGLPGETTMDFFNTLDWAKKMAPDYANFSVVIPYPGTELYERALKKKILKKDIWKDFVLHPTAEMVLPIYTERYSRNELLRMQKEIIHDFYFRSKYIAQQLVKLRSFDQVRRKAGMALSLLKA